MTKDKDMIEQAAAAPPQKDEDSLIEMAKAMAIAGLIALTVRSFAFEPFNIPSGSLLPTLQVGDYLFAEKYAYGYDRYSFPFGLVNFEGRFFARQPARGDIAVFRHPHLNDIDYIKRIVGLPGDTVQVKDGILYINDKAVMRDYRGSETVNSDDREAVYKRYIETLPNGVQHYTYEMSDHEKFDDTPPVTVPPGYFFAMGDNRDNSLDSRSDELGLVPEENLIGRAWFIFFSTQGVGDKCKQPADSIAAVAALKSAGCHLIEWPQAIRWGRIFKNVNKL